MKISRFGIYCALGVCLLVCSMANGAKAQPQQMRFKHIGIADGLPQSTVYTMLQDSTGFIWIGTNDGLGRYDGNTFRVFRKNEQQSYSLVNNVINCLEQDGHGHLLIGTDDGLDRYDPRSERFTHILLPYNVDRTVSAMKKDSRGRIWIGVGNSLLAYDPETQRCTKMAIPGLSDLLVSCILEASDKTLWLSCGSHILRYDPSTGDTLPVPGTLLANRYYGKSNINVIRQDSAGNIWIATYKDGVILLDPTRRQCTSFRDEKGSAGIPFTKEMVRDIFFYGDYTWIATRHGMFQINREHRVEHCYLEDKFDPSSLSSSSVICFMKDRAGNVWIGTYSGGVNVEYPGNDNFGSINQLANNGQGLSNNVVSCIKEDRNGNLWIGTEGGGLNYYNRKTGQIRSFRIDASNPSRNINYDFVRSLAFQDDDHLWVGTLGGFFSYNLTSGSYTAVTLPGPGDIPVSLLTAEDGLWIGTPKGLLFREKNGTIHRYQHDPHQPGSLVDDKVYQLCRDSRKGLWLGTTKGLTYLPAGANTFLNFKPGGACSAAKDVIQAIMEDRNGTVWIGTKDNGLLYYDRAHGQFGQIDSTFGLNGNSVHGIIQDSRGYLWVSYNSSLARISLKKPLPPFARPDVECMNYSMNNGLVANEFHNVAYRASDGEVLFGGRNGLIYFYPGKVVINTFKPPVVFTDLLIKNQPVPIDTGGVLPRSVTYMPSITLDHDQACFTLRFAALNYINPSTNQYAYMMEGLSHNEQWNYVGSQSSATYTNLSPGSYIFKVKAANNDGFWNEQYTTLRIRVLPPIWNTWYANLLYAVAICGLLYLFYSYSVKTTRLKNEQELAGRKLNFFTNISHEIKTPLTLILAPLEKLSENLQANPALNEQLSLLQKNGERLMRLMDQLLDFRKFEEGCMQLETEHTDLVPFTRDIVGAFEGLSYRRNIRLLFNAEQETVLAWIDRDKFEKILYNLLSNSLKFTRPGGRVIVSLKMAAAGRHEKVVLQIEDNGAGIAPDRLDNIFEQFRHYDDTGRQVGGTGIGLAFTRGLVGLHRGTINVISRQPCSGQEGYTCFTVQMPADAQFLRSARKPLPSQVSTWLPPYDDADIAGFGPPGPTAPEMTPISDKPVLLVVEDHAEVLSFIADHYQQRFTVYTASDGQRGLEMAFRLLPDIIVSDVMMPGMSGTEMCRLLKTDLRTCHIPIILLTARNANAHRQEGFVNKADDYITKPFSVSLLDTRVANLLECRRQLREQYAKRVLLEPAGQLLSSPDEEFIEKLKQYLDDNIMESDLAVETLAQAMNMSRMTLYRKIKALTNQSVLEFIRGYRLKKAAQLLTRQGFTVNEVAYLVGFSDPDHFRKLFKKEFQQTPREFASAQAGENK